MKTKMIIVFSLILLIAPFAIADQVNYSVRMNTAPLLGHLASPFYLAFELADGEGVGDGNNLALLTDFQFSPQGGPSGVPLLFGSAFGDLGSEVVLSDATPQSIFVQMFDPGDWLGFNLLMSTNSDSGGLPDGFVFSILDRTLTPIPTQQGGPLSPFLSIELDPDGPLVQTFATDSGQLPTAGGPAIQMDAPVVGAPEPGGMILAGFALILIGTVRKHQQKSDS